MGKYTHQDYNIEPKMMSRFCDLGLGKVYYCFHPVIEVFLFFLCIERGESFFDNKIPRLCHFPSDLYRWDEPVDTCLVRTSALVRGLQIRRLSELCLCWLCEASWVS